MRTREDTQRPNTMHPILFAVPMRVCSEPALALDSTFLTPQKYLLKNFIVAHLRN